MPDLTVRIAIACVLIAFVVAVLTLNKPVTREGKLSLRLSLGNVLSWLILLPMTEGGHPPLWLIVGSFLYLFNFPLLIAAATVLWNAFKGRKEKRGYLTVATAYIVMNLIVLYAAPALFLFLWSPIFTS